MNYTIIEDCSPYYIRFTYPGIEQYIKYTLDMYNRLDWSTVVSKIKIDKFKHCILPESLGKYLLNLTPVSTDISLNAKRVSFFQTQPGLYYRAHKDGKNLKFGINYTLKILDDKCVTSWYSDDDLKHYTIDTLKNSSRECVDFIKENHIPLKSMVASQGECILFNTEIYHDWDNSRSTNERIVLTLRSDIPENIYFEDAKKALFKSRD